eukprot:g1610.t1
MLYRQLHPLQKCEVEHLAWATDKTKTDLNLWKCNAGCLCKAIGTASNQPTWTMPTTNGMGPTTSALQPQHTGMGALYDTHQGTVNRYDAVCYALLRPGSEHYDDWVQIFEGGEKPSSPTAASSQKAFLGDNNECLDLCFRLAAYYYGSPEHGSACQLFGWMQPTTPQSPNGLPGKDYVVAGTGETALVRLRVGGAVSSFGGPVFCLKACPNANTLAAGCEDGRVRLFEARRRIEERNGRLENDTECLTFRKGTSLAGGRITALAWHMDGEILFSGSADGRIRCVEAESGKTLHSMSVDRYNRRRGKGGGAREDDQGTTSRSAIVWTLDVLQDLTVVSGDSRGHVQIWDGRGGTLLQSFVTHDADVLALAVSNNERHIFATGVDSKIMQLTLMESGGGGVARAEDGNGESNGREILLSGGVDAKLCYRDVTTWEKQSNFGAKGRGGGHQTHKNKAVLGRKRARSADAEDSDDEERNSLAIGGASTKRKSKTEKMLPFWPGSTVRIVEAMVAKTTTVSPTIRRRRQRLVMPNGGLVVAHVTSLDLWALGISEEDADEERDEDEDDNDDAVEEEEEKRATTTTSSATQHRHVATIDLSDGDEAGMKRNGRSNLPPTLRDVDASSGGQYVAYILGTSLRIVYVYHQPTAATALKNKNEPSSGGATLSHDLAVRMRRLTIPHHARQHRPIGVRFISSNKQGQQTRLLVVTDEGLLVVYEILESKTSISSSSPANESATSDPSRIVRLVSTFDHWLATRRIEATRFGGKIVPTNDKFTTKADDDEKRTETSGRNNGHARVLNGPKEESSSEDDDSDDEEEDEDDELFDEKRQCPLVRWDASDRWLVASDARGNVHVFDVAKKRYACTIQTATAYHPPLTSLGIVGTSEQQQRIVLVSADNNVKIYDPSRERFDVEWKNGLKGLSKVRQHPYAFSEISFDEKSRHLFLASVMGMCSVPLIEEGGEHETPAKATKRKKTKNISTKKTKSNKDDELTKLRRCKFVDGSYKPLLGAKLIEPGCLAAVQTPWFKMLQHLPPPLYRKRYGT